MRTIFIVMDTLNRRLLETYGGTWVQTPNISRLAARSAVFDNHWCGSLPCMPARREMMTGRINFLEAPWGPIEPFDDCLPTALRRHGIHTHLITDHYHYFEIRGSHYHTLFSTWEFHRGQEGDPWKPQVNDPVIPEHYGKNRRQDWINRQWIQDEEDFSGPRCFKSAIEYLDLNKDADDWHLHLEVFDPHEPFYIPQKYKDLYPDDWDEYVFDWPKYERVKQPPEAIAHARHRYAALLTMTDHWLGKLLDKMDELDMWKDTAVVLTTDHGLMLGEHGFWMKNYMPVYNEIAHIPLIFHHPDLSGAGRRIKSLTTTIDTMPTILDLHGAPPPPHVQGKSLLSLLEKDAPIRDAVLYGYFGKEINVTDGRYTYFREPVPGGKVYHYTAQTVWAFDNPKQRQAFASAEHGAFLDHTDGFPVFRLEKASSTAEGALPFSAVYDVKNDPGQERPIQGGPVEASMVEKLRALLREYGAPKEQFTRMGLD